MVSKAVQESQAGLQNVLVHTGQHYDPEMSAIFFEELGIPEPACNLGVGSVSHGRQTSEMLTGLEEILCREEPDVVLVYGDTNTTLAGALAAAKLQIPLAHVEAGLRSWDKSMPEEINRVLVDHVSNFLFCPTEGSVENLEKEGIAQGVSMVGDVMLDAVLCHSALAQRISQILSTLAIQPKNYVLATIHRAANTDNLHNLGRILRALEKLGETVVFPVHPRTRHAIERLEPSAPIPEHVRMIPPVSYLDMLQLEQNARLILTDSGGVQKESYFFKVPCVTLRENTEWLETVDDGWNVLLGTDEDVILKTVKEFKPGGDQRARFGDGHAATKITQILAAAMAGKDE
jgi:UDP-N-acetylglucosamine 2-epimerase (non-hydrolysing)